MNDSMAILAAWAPQTQSVIPWPAPPQVVESAPMPSAVVAWPIAEALGSTRLNAAARSGVGTLSRS